MVYDYSCADWDDLHDNLRDVPWEDTFRLSASAVASEFCDWVQVGIGVCVYIYIYIYISLIVSIRSNLTHLHDFQLLAMLQ